MNTYDKELSIEELLALKDEDIDTTDIPELDKNFWKKAKLVRAKNKKAISLRIDQDTLEWFKNQDGSYQSLMNDVLKSYMLATRDDNHSC